jgi:hypothetical protein
MSNLTVLYLFFHKTMFHFKPWIKDLIIEFIISLHIYLYKNQNYYSVLFQQRQDIPIF